MKNDKSNFEKVSKGVFESFFRKKFKGENRKLLDEGIGLVVPK